MAQLSPGVSHSVEMALQPIVFPDLKGAHCHCHKWAAQEHAQCLCTGVTTGLSSHLLFIHINLSIPPWEDAEEVNKVNCLWACRNSCATRSNVEKENSKFS